MPGDAGYDSASRRYVIQKQKGVTWGIIRVFPVGGKLRKDVLILMSHAHSFLHTLTDTHTFSYTLSVSSQGCYSAVVDYFEMYIYVAGALAIVVLTIEVTMTKIII